MTLTRPPRPTPPTEPTGDVLPVWHGTATDLDRLHEALLHHCARPGRDEAGTPVRLCAECASCRWYTTQYALDQAAFARWLRGRLEAEEWEPWEE